MEIITKINDQHIQDFIRRRNEFFDAAQLQQFGGCATDLDRYAIVHEALEKRRQETPLIDNVTPVDEKNLQRALEFKQKGNDFFKQSNWVDALKCYTLSYLQTPQENSETHPILYHSPPPFSQNPSFLS